MNILDMRGFLETEAGKPMLNALRQHFNEEVALVTPATSPKNAEEWLETCQKYGNTEADSVVLLPGEKPLPIPAVNAGYTHIAVMPDGIFKLTGQEVRKTKTGKELVLVMEKITK